jgi:hypothetical protein
MANTYTLIQSVTVGSGGAASIEFGSIPQTYTDLKIVHSLRSTRASAAGTLRLYLNGLSTNGSGRVLYGETTGVGSLAPAYVHAGYFNDANLTANVFGSGEIYIPNYAGSTNKSFSSDSVTESNATTYQSGVQGLVAGLWSSTAAITAITLILQDGGNFVQHSSASLYGIKNS